MTHGRLLTHVLICGVLILVLGSPVAAQTTATYVAKEDTSLDENSPNADRCWDPVLNVISWDLDPTRPPGDNWRTIVQFGQLSTLTNVKTATLRLCLIGLSMSSPGRFYDVHHITTPWSCSPQSPTWNFPWFNPGGDFYPWPTATRLICKKRPCLPVDHTPKWIEWDVTADVTSGHADNGWLIKDRVENSPTFEAARFASLEHPGNLCGDPSGSSAPQLVIEEEP